MNIKKVESILDCVLLDRCDDIALNDHWIIKNLLSERIPILNTKKDSSEIRAANVKRILRFENLIRRISKYCREHDVKYYFPKAFQHYPDMGNDIDLFIDIESSSLEDFVTHFELKPDETSFLNIISGKKPYLYNNEIPLETHKYAGHFGEFKSLTIEFYDNLVYQNEVLQLQDEFKFINQIIQRFYGHFSIRISDIIYSINLLNNGLDLDFIKTKSYQYGLKPALDEYLNFIFKNFNKYITKEYDYINSSSKSIRIVFSTDHFIVSKRFAIWLYFNKLVTDLWHLRIYSAMKMLSTPFVGLVLIFRKLSIF